MAPRITFTEEIAVTSHVKPVYLKKKKQQNLVCDEKEDWPSKLAFLFPKTDWMSLNSCGNAEAHSS